MEPDVMCIMHAVCRPSVPADRHLAAVAMQVTVVIGLDLSAALNTEHCPGRLLLHSQYCCPE